MTIDELRRDVESVAFGLGSEERGEDGPDGRVGLEAEFFLVRTDRIGTAEAQVGRTVVDGWNLFGLLDHLAERCGWIRTSDTPAPAWRLPEGSHVTLEPGGQVELSTPPRDSADEALDEIERFEMQVADALPSPDLELRATGFNDFIGDAEPELVVEKPRYLAMDRHFAEIGPWGRMMMRRTASTQVNLDFAGDRSERLERFRSAVEAARIGTELNRVWSLPELGSFSRIDIWHRTDPSRAGLPPSFSGPDPLSAWLDFALDASIIDPSSSWIVPFRSRLGSNDTTLADWHDHQTTLFPDVRARGFIEIRTLDAMSAGERRRAVSAVVDDVYGARQSLVPSACSGRAL